MRRSTAIFLAAILVGAAASVALPVSAESQAQQNTAYPMPDPLWDAMMAEGAKEREARAQRRLMEDFAAYTAASQKRQTQKLGFALIGLFILFGGMFLILFIARRTKAISQAGESALVSALATTVKAKRRAAASLGRLKAKVDEKLDAEKSPPERP